MAKKPPKTQPTAEVLSNRRFRAARKVADKSGKSASERKTDLQLFKNADRALKRQQAASKKRKKWMSIEAAYNQVLFDLSATLKEKNILADALQKIIDCAPANGEDVSFLIAKGAIDSVQTGLN